MGEAEGAELLPLSVPPPAAQLALTPHRKAQPIGMPV